MRPSGGVTSLSPGEAGSNLANYAKMPLSGKHIVLTTSTGTEFTYHR